MPRKKNLTEKLVTAWIHQTNQLHEFEQELLELEQTLIEAITEQTLPAEQQSLADRFYLAVGENGRLQMQIGNERTVEESSDPYEKSDQAVERSLTA